MTGWLSRRRKDDATVPPPQLDEARSAVEAAEASLESARRRWVPVNLVAWDVDAVLVENHFEQRLRNAYGGN
ncbi:DUF7620 family protein [Georgenia wangjunii]|uniref:DUF7620 family protein n=1 Tax=Georgenia wangjunii TaxID=3117730 RepID=UPI002F2619ED